MLESWTPPPVYGYGYAQPRPTNGLAIASMVLSLVGLVGGCGWITCPLGAILGYRARRQIKMSGEGGDGMARAGIIVGWIGAVLHLLFLAGWVALVWYSVTHATSPTSTD